MKGEITSILGSNKSRLTGDDDITEVGGDWVTQGIPIVSWQPLGCLECLITGRCPCQAKSEEDEDVFDSSRESVELFCVHAREKLTNSIRLQWRKLKNHVERLDSQGITFKLCHMDTREIPVKIIM